MAAIPDDARWQYVDVARSSSERGEVVLRRRLPADVDVAEVDEGDGVLELRVNGVFVMDTLETASEQRLATLALSQVERPRSVVVGGLGLGFTVRAVLMDQRVERLFVVEIEEALVGWMRDGTVPHGPAYLADERVSLVHADIRQAMSEATPEAHDLVLLDVDNGPGFLVLEDNAAVYRAEFLAGVRAALRSGGAVVVWSASPAPDLEQALRQVFGAATPVPSDVRLQGREEQYWLYLAHR